jgi:anti-anti-sigma factor
MSEYQHLDVLELGEAILVRFKEPHLLSDCAIPCAIGNELDELADQPGCRIAVIDFFGLDYVSSLMLGLLVAFRKQVMSKGGQLVLCGLSPEVRELFDSTMPSQSWNIWNPKERAQWLMRAGNQGREDAIEALESLEWRASRRNPVAESCR